MKKWHPNRQKKKELPAVKANRNLFQPPATPQVVFFRRCGRGADFICCSPMQHRKRKR